MAEMFYIPYDEIRVNDGATRDYLISEEMVAAFSAVIGDRDSFHVRDESASLTVFKKRIAHGVHLLAFISCLIGQELPGFGTVYCSHEFSFMRPVYLGESVTVCVEVIDKLPHRLLKLKTQIIKNGAETVLDGVAIVKTYM